ncbi:DUF2971 domain-containing protein [Azonexus sp. IMCC34842]|uniref:DUF2971 domain-containing protein n=1 Tax=Azonexus sp. IMCC34842 TaxID=3420950 RepID=UPI003D0A6F9A
MNTLYHYCTVQTLLAILNGKTVWLSDASKMNDSHEVVWADRLLEQVLRERHASMSDEDRNQFALGYNLNRPQPFIFCLSTEPDILSQWRAYAGDGMGVAIGFKSDIFPRQNHLPSTNIVPQMNTALWEVTYDIEEQRRIVDTLFGRACSSPDICVAEGGRPDYQLLGCYMAGISPMLKNPAFREEKEWRLIHTPRLMTDANNKHTAMGTTYKIGQRVSNHQIITHFEFPLPATPTDVISEIWLGPRALVSAQDVELTLALNEIGPVAIRHSSATYR